MAAQDTSLTAIARARAEYNEQQVLLARAVESERRVVIVRLVFLFLASVSQAVIGPLSGAQATDISPRRLVPVATYAAFSAFIAFGVWFRVKSTPLRARVFPLMATVFDIGFIVAMHLADRAAGRDELAITGVSLAVVVSYAILRYHVESLVISTVAACGVFTWLMVLGGQYTLPRATLACFFFIALASMLTATRRAIRTAFLELKRREQLTRLVPTKVAEEILAGRSDVLKSARREVTVLFSDVRGFTSFSESREPEAVLALLDDYFGRMTQIVQGHDGSVNKFIGDGMLALWGAPQSLDDHPVHAVKAALDMQKVVGELNDHRARAGEPPIAVGIGVHTGAVAAGMLGSSSQSEYTVIGDAVNLASRIEGLTKEAGAMLLVSEATWERLGGRFEGRRLGEFTVKGRQAPVVIYGVTAVLPRA
ncbi:MAG: adenylate/guanylate cyclase domain-containing protein [Myxococcaceae bacterium]